MNCASPVTVCPSLKYYVLLLFVLFWSLTHPQRAWAQSAPQIIPSTGIYFPGPSVILFSPTGGTIYYTLDNTLPTINSQIYSTPLKIKSSTTINTMVVQSGTSSPVATAYFKVDPTAVPLFPSVSNTQPYMWLRSDLGVTSASGKVSNWLDLSGDNLNATQSNSSNQPGLVLNDLNGYSSIFTSTNSFFNLPSINSSFTSSFFVTKPTSSSNGALMVFGNGSTYDSVTTSSLGSSATFTNYVLSTPESVTASSALTLGQYQELESCLESPTGVAPYTGNIYTNGVQVGSASFPNGVDGPTRSNNFIGADYTGGANFFNGGFLEVLLYQNEPNHLDAIDMYLLTRYQLLTAVPAPPIISVPTATLSGPVQVAIAIPPDCACRFTVDGSTPVNTSPLYTGPIQIGYTQTLNAIALKNGVSSSVSSASYTLDSSQWPAPNPTDTTPLQVNVQSPTNN
jgi:hypothetical protein